jgi:hypothetical protein
MPKLLASCAALLRTSALNFLLPFLRIFCMGLSIRRISKVSARKNRAESVDANLDLPRAGWEWNT